MKGLLPYRPTFMDRDTNKVPHGYDQACNQVWFAMLYEAAMKSPAETAGCLVRNLAPSRANGTSFRWNFRTSVTGVAHEIRLRVDSVLVFKWPTSTTLFVHDKIPEWRWCPDMSFLLRDPAINHTESAAGTCSRLDPALRCLVFQLAARHLRLRDIKSCVETYSKDMTHGMLNHNVWLPYNAGLMRAWSLNAITSKQSPPTRYRALPQHVQWAQNTFAGHAHDFSLRGLEWLSMEENDGAITSLGLAASVRYPSTVIPAQEKNYIMRPETGEYVVAGKRKRSTSGLEVMELNITDRGSPTTARKRVRTYSRHDVVNKKRRRDPGRKATLALFTTPHVIDVPDNKDYPKEECLLYVTPAGELMVRGRTRFFHMCPEVAASVLAKEAIRGTERDKDLV